LRPFFITIISGRKLFLSITQLSSMPQDENGSLTVTYTIIGINVLVFMIMGLQGAGVFEANGLVHLRWGSNYGTLTASGDWWRLFTAIFLHFGIIHLALNMYALFSIAAYLEPMLGKLRYITAYLCCGILASLASLCWHTEPVNSAGASGAVFGMYGVFLALLTTNLIPKQVRRPVLLSIVIFVIYNIANGIKGGIDGAAHIGGLVSGAIIGYLFAFSIKKERKQQTASWVVPAVIILSVLICGWYLQQIKISAEVRNTVLREIKNDSYPDVDRFKELYDQFVIVQHDALQIYHEYGDNLSGLPKSIKEQFTLKLDEANSIAVKMMNLDVGDEMKGLAATVNRYVGLRKKEMELTLRISEQPDNADTLTIAREQVKKEIDKELLKLK
jgi:membrane associated rhomboid family serine protease